MRIAYRTSDRICFADGQTYGILDLNYGRVTPLFPYDSTFMQPLVVPVDVAEFLLVTSSGPNQPSIGVFVNALDGSAVRGTIQWGTLPLSIGAYTRRLACVTQILHTELKHCDLVVISRNRLPVPVYLRPDDKRNLRAQYSGSKVDSSVESAEPSQQIQFLVACVGTTAIAFGIIDVAELTG